MVEPGLIFLNVDAGELESEPDELYALAHAVSIACGGHAGDERSMERVLRACTQTKTRVGAHPAYEDRAGFGRRDLEVDPETLSRSVQAQCARLRAVARAVGVEIAHVKPHGALYHAANRDPRIARAVIAGAQTSLGAPLVIGPELGELRRAAEEAGLAFSREGFADRALRSDGSLVPRGEPGALITDPRLARAQAGRLARTGTLDTLCIHADSPGALEIARAVRSELDEIAKAPRPAHDQ
jgi:UPF0271 protein